MEAKTWEDTVMSRKQIVDILRERQLIPPGMQLDTIELMKFRAVWEEGRREVVETLKRFHPVRETRADGVSFITITMQLEDYESL